MKPIIDIHCHSTLKSSAYSFENNTIGIIHKCSNSKWYNHLPRVSHSNDIAIGVNLFSNCTDNIDISNYHEHGRFTPGERIIKLQIKSINQIQNMMMIWKQ